VKKRRAIKENGASAIAVEPLEDIDDVEEGEEEYEDPGED
jgi:hypothetical protein